MFPANGVRIQASSLASLYDGELMVDTIGCMGYPLCGFWAGHTSVEGLSIGELGSHITCGLGVLGCVGV